MQILTIAILHKQISAGTSRHLVACMESLRKTAKHVLTGGDYTLEAKPRSVILQYTALGVPYRTGRKLQAGARNKEHKHSPQIMSIWSSNQNLLDRKISIEQVKVSKTCKLQLGPEPLELTLLELRNLLLSQAICHSCLPKTFVCALELKVLHTGPLTNGLRRKQ